MKKEIKTYTDMVEDCKNVLSESDAILQNAMKNVKDANGASDDDKEFFGELEKILKRMKNFSKELNTK